jgi:hypothetical protein
MKARHSRTLILFLTLGALLNVTVAWTACTIVGFFEPKLSMQVYATSAAGPCWIMESHRHFGFVRMFSRMSLGSLPGVTVINGMGWGSPSIPREQYWDSSDVIEQAGGWPMLSMWCGLETRGFGIKDGGTVFYATYRTSWDLGGLSLATTDRANGGPGLFSVAVPLKPIWRGFAVNTLVYAMILWLMRNGRGIWQRLRAYRTNLCMNCGYPIGQSPLCTECGTPVGRKERSASGR